VLFSGGHVGRGSVSPVLDAGARPGQPASGVACQAGGRRDADAARRGAADPGAEPATSRGTDAGLNAQQAWARWATVSADGAPPIPAIPLPLPKHGRPTVLAVDPPAGSGLTSTSLQQLAGDAAQRAWELAHGERSTGLELPKVADLARRAAAMLTPTTGQREIIELASSAGVSVRDLLNQAGMARRRKRRVVRAARGLGRAARLDDGRAGAARWAGDDPAQPRDAWGATTSPWPRRSLVSVPAIEAWSRCGRVDA